MAHDDKKWTKGMTPAEKKKFEKKDDYYREKNKKNNSFLKIIIRVKQR